MKKKNHPSELLYGHSGYLSALLYVKVHHEDDLIPDRAISKMVECIVNTGLSGKRFLVTFHYFIHGTTKQYIGAAHGYIRYIVYVTANKIVIP